MFAFFFFNVTATTEIYTLSLHDALPISVKSFWWDPYSGSFRQLDLQGMRINAISPSGTLVGSLSGQRSEEHTSELQSQFHLVCRLLLEKKNNNIRYRALHRCARRPVPQL